MNEQERGGNINISIGGGVNDTQLAVGTHITQVKTVVPADVIGEEGLAELRAQIAEIRRQVEAEAPPELQAEADARVAELEEALTTGAPKPSKLAAARDWFVDHLPQAAGAVTSLVIHPLVGRLVEAAGDAIVDEFRRLIGVEPGSGSS